jgi:transposase-like protein
VAKHPLAAEKITKNRDALAEFHDAPNGHRPHVRSTNPIELTLETVRHRTDLARNCLSRSTVLRMAFKLIEAAE